MMKALHPLILLAGVLVLCHGAEAAPDRDAGRYAAAIEKINAAHLKSPGEVTEDALERKISKSAVAALERVLKAKSSPETAEALVKCGEAALDLAAMEHFGRIRARLLQERECGPAENVAKDTNPHRVVGSRRVARPRKH